MFDTLSLGSQTPSPLPKDVVQWYLSDPKEKKGGLRCRETTSGSDSIGGPHMSKYASDPSWEACLENIPWLGLLTVMSEGFTAYLHGHKGRGRL